MAQQTTTFGVRKVEALAFNVQKLVGKFSSALCGVGLSILFGFDPLPSFQPLHAFWTDNRIGTAFIVAIIVIISVISFIITQRRREHQSVQKRFVRFLGLASESIGEIVIGFLAGLLLGIGSAPSSIPLLALIRNHPPVGIGLGAFFIAILILTPLLVGAEESPHPELPSPHPRSRLWLATATSFISLLLLFTLIGLITIRPAWCPSTICPAPSLIIVTNPNGVNDGIMESYYLAQQSNVYVLTQAPSTYTFNNLPNSVGAVEINKALAPYRAVIGIHSLQRHTPYGLVIDGVDVIIDTATQISAPVNVFKQGASLSYNSNIFTSYYNGQPAPISLPAKTPVLTVTLEAGGSDELTIQMASQQEVSLQFRLRVSYHEIVGGGLQKTLVVPHEFAVDFISPTHWKPYIFKDGQMIPQP